MNNATAGNGFNTAGLVQLFASNPQLLAWLVAQQQQQAQALHIAQSHLAMPSMPGSLSQGVFQNANPFVLSPSSFGLPSAIGAFGSASNSNLMHQQAQDPAQGLATDISPSSEHDAEIAALLRDAKHQRDSFSRALEHRATTHGYSPNQWKDYALNRIDDIVALATLQDTTPLQQGTVKRPVVGTPSHDQPNSSASSAVPADMYGQPSASAPSAAAPESCPRKRPRQPEEDSDDTTEAGESQFFTPEPESTANAQRTSGKARVTQATKRQHKMARVKSVADGDRLQYYSPSEEMSKNGGSITSGDLDAVARWIVEHPEFWGDAKRWKKLSDRYPQREAPTWNGLYNARANEVNRRVYILENKSERDETMAAEESERG